MVNDQHSPPAERALATTSAGEIEHARRRLLVWPHPGPMGPLAQWLSNRLPARLLCRLAGLMPRLRSDVRDVVYLNWLVPTERARPYVPEPLALHTLGADGAWTAVTVLTYRHGGFGPAWLGPLRRLLPSPQQSNWRLYLAPSGPEGEQDAVYFLTNVLDSRIYTVGSRLLSDGLPAHLAAHMKHESTGGVWATLIVPGQGSAPDLASEVRVGSSPPTAAALPATFRAHFADATQAIEYLVTQSRALDIHRWHGAVRQSKIHIPIDLSKVRRADVLRFESRWLATLVEDAPCFAFYVPSVRFEALGESALS